MTHQQAYTQALNLYQAGEPQEALKLTMQLARQARRHPPTRLVHGMALAACGRFVEAAEEIREAGELMDAAPDQEATEVRALRTRSRIELARALAEIGEAEAALVEADEALKPDEFNAQAVAAKARAQVAADDFAGAAETLSALLIGDATDPEIALAASEVAVRSDAITAEAVIENMEALTKQVGHPTRLLRPMLRALGLMLDRVGRHDDAWVALRRGTNLSVAEFDPRAFGQAVATITQHWTASGIKTVKRPTAPSPALLVVGLAGSRTDAVGRIIGAHPEGGWAGQTLTLSQLAERFLDAKIVGGVSLVDSPVKVRGKACVEAAGVYEKRLRKRSAGEDLRVIADTNPDNATSLGIASLVAPGLKVICVRREAVAASFEAHALESTPAEPYACDQMTLAAHAFGTNRLLEHWKEVFEDGSLGASWMDVEFDALRTDPAGTARAIVAFAGLGWDDACGAAAAREAALPVLDVEPYRGHIKSLISGLGPLAAARA
ncbi:MAG: sulfotransferase [Phycisphaerales bacterium]